MSRDINTVKRFIYINTYALLLLLGAIAVCVPPLYKYGWWWLAAQIAAAVALVGFSLKIFLQFNDKRREYRYLMERNATELHPRSFCLYATAPCSRLLMRLVIKDLGYGNDVYRDLVKRYK